MNSKSILFSQTTSVRKTELDGGESGYGMGFGRKKCWFVKNKQKFSDLSQLCGKKKS